MNKLELSLRTVGGGSSSLRGLFEKTLQIQLLVGRSCLPASGNPVVDESFGKYLALDRLTGHPRWIISVSHRKNQ